MFNCHGGIQPMMGKLQESQPRLFYTDFSLDGRLGADHPLRKIKRLIDFTFVRSEVAELYGAVGNTSVDPVVILKLVFLLFYENVKSERALMEQLPLRLDWLWFCGYDIEDKTPNHSVLSKARRRWGSEIFAKFFECVLDQCIDAGLVDGQVVHIDSSMIEANASKDKLRPELRQIGANLYDNLESRCEKPAGQSKQADREGQGDDYPPQRRVNPVDPDARLGKKYGKSTFGYKDHRAIDDRCGIITATVMTGANVNDSEVMVETLWEHETNTKTQSRTVVADKGYGVIENYRYLHDRGTDSCIPHQRRAHKKGKFCYEKFRYDKEHDCYICPAGEELHKAHEGVNKRAYCYRCPRETCRACNYFSECVTSEKRGRLVTRNIDADYIDWADSCLSRADRRRLQGRRRYKAEGSFADAANNHNFKRARWRGFTGMRIQSLMIAAAQNLRKLLRYWPLDAARAASAAGKTAVLQLYRLVKCFAELQIGRDNCSTMEISIGYTLIEN
jgi:transposase